MVWVHDYTMAKTLSFAVKNENHLLLRELAKKYTIDVNIILQ